jgi:peptidoglycan/LPS O-acetylase OafA/YrhL
VLFGWLVLSPEEFRQLSKHTLGGATFTSNLMYWSEVGYFDNASITKPLLHLWSLSIEEQFYIIWPPLVVFAFNRKILPLIIFFVLLSSFAFNIYLSSHSLAMDFYSPATRFWELACGSVLAWLAQNRSPSLHRMPWIGNTFSFLGLLLISGGFYLISTEARFPGWWAILPVLGTSLVIISGPESFPNKKILSNAGLVWVGLISYPLYLVH